jgi:hypothetical protein
MMRTLESNTIVLGRMTTTYQEVVCDLPAGMEVEFDGEDAFIRQQNRHDPAERKLRADRALKDGFIFVTNGKSDRTIVARLRIETLSYIICDVPRRYVVGCDAGELYLMKRNKKEPQPQKWPVATLDEWPNDPKGVLTAYTALAKGIIRVRTQQRSFVKGNTR